MEQKFQRAKVRGNESSIIRVKVSTSEGNRGLWPSPAYTLMMMIRMNVPSTSATQYYEFYAQNNSPGRPTV